MTSPESSEGHFADFAETERRDVKKRGKLWRPAGWAEIDSDLPRRPPTEGEAKGNEIRATTHKATLHRKDQAYNPARLQQETERLAKKMAPPRNKVTGRTLRVPDPKYMTDAELLAYAQVLAEEHRFDWKANARPEQREPEDYETWLLLAGRGFGKSRTGSETVRKWACDDFPGGRFAIVARDHKTLRDVCFEGECGLTKTIPQKFWLPKEYKRGLGDVSLTLKNGSIIQGFTAHEPDALRGPAFDGMWGDEWAAWPKVQAQEVLDMFWMTSRENERARLVLTTTPKRIPFVQAMLKKAEDPEEKIVITRGRTEDNTALPEKARARLYRMFAGTRQGRQELDGELVLDLDLALWTGEMIDGARWDGDEDYPPALMKTITGVDPSGSNDGDATGIVTIGWDKHKVIYVLENVTTKGTPAHRYAEACRSAWRYKSREIWYESAYGGDNAKFGIETQWKYLIEQGEIPEGTPCPPVKPSTIKGDKAARAMPVVALYEQQINLPDTRRIWHPRPSLKDDEHDNGITMLEDEQLSWETNTKPSPNAIDALVHAVRQAMRQLGMETVVSRPSAQRRVSKGWSPPARR